MVDVVYTDMKRALMAGDADWDEGQDDVRVMLVMTNTTADTEQDAIDIGELATLDEFDGSGYTGGPGGSGRLALANQANVADNANNRGEFDADDLTWSALGAGARDIEGLVVIKNTSGSNDQLNLLIAHTSAGGFPITANGGDLTVQWNAEGIIQLT